MQWNDWYFRFFVFWYWMVLDGGIAWYCMVLDGDECCWMLLNGIKLYYMVWNGIQK